MDLRFAEDGSATVGASPPEPEMQVDFVRPLTDRTDRLRAVDQDDEIEARVMGGPATTDVLPALEDGRVAAARQIGREQAQAVTGFLPGITGIDEVVATSMAAGAGFFAPILTILDRTMGGRDSTSKIDETIAHLEGMAEGYKAGSDLHPFAFDAASAVSQVLSGGGAMRATARAYAYGASRLAPALIARFGPRAASTMLVGTGYVASGAGSAAQQIEVRNMDPVTGKILVDPQAEVKRAWVTGAVTGALDTYGTAAVTGAGKAISKLTGQGGIPLDPVLKYAERAGVTFLKRLGWKMQIEGGTEAAQNLLTSAMANTATPNSDLFRPGDFVNAAYDGLIGMIAGGVAGVPSTVTELNEELAQAIKDPAAQAAFRADLDNKRQAALEKLSSDAPQQEKREAAGELIGVSPEAMEESVYEDFEASYQEELSERAAAHGAEEGAAQAAADPLNADAIAEEVRVLGEPVYREPIPTYTPGAPLEDPLAPSPTPQVAPQAQNLPATSPVQPATPKAGRVAPIPGVLATRLGLGGKAGAIVSPGAPGASVSPLGAGPVTHKQKGLLTALTPKQQTVAKGAQHNAIVGGIVQQIEASTTLTETGQFTETGKGAGVKARVLGKKVQGPALPSFEDARTIGKAESYSQAHERPARFFKRIQGGVEEGWATRHFWHPINRAAEAFFLRFDQGIKKRVKAFVQSQGGDAEFGRKFYLRSQRPLDPAGVALTGQERVGIAMGILDGGVSSKLSVNNGILQADKASRPLTLAEQLQVAKSLNPAETAMADFLRTHWNAQGRSLAAVAARMNLPFTPRKNYMPNMGESLVPVGEDLRSSKQSFSDLLDSYFNIARKPDAIRQRVRIDAFDMFLEQAEDAEFWMTHVEALSGAEEILEDQDFRDAVNSKFGRKARKASGQLATSTLDQIENLVKDVANRGNRNGRFDALFAKLRYDATVSVLGLKVGVMMKQPISTLKAASEYAFIDGKTTGSAGWKTMAKMAAEAMPRTVLAVRKVTHKGRFTFGQNLSQVDRVVEQIPFIHQRIKAESAAFEAEAILEGVKDVGVERKILRRIQGKNKIIVGGQEFAEGLARVGMRGMVIADQAASWAVAEMIVKDQLDSGASEQDAIRVAQRVLERTQLLSSTRYLPMAYRSGEMMKTLLLFTSEISQDRGQLLEGFRKAFGSKVLGGDDRDLSALVAVVAMFLAGTFISSAIDQAFRVTAESMPRQMVANFLRYSGGVVGGGLGGWATGALTSATLYNGAYGDDPVNPALEAGSKGMVQLSRAAKKAYAGTFDEDDALMTARAGSALVGVGAGLPLQGALNSAIGLHDAVMGGTLNPGERFTALMGLNRTARGVGPEGVSGRRKQSSVVRP